MSNQIYRQTMEAARRAKREGLDLKLVAPPVGRLRDAFMQEYERYQPVPVGACRKNCEVTVLNDNGVGECPHREHW